MKKHAFLIIAHKDDKNFRTLLSLLDDERNDLFIHMDKKNRDYNIKMIESFVKHANVFHAKRYKVFWGSFSMVKAELSLLQKATREGTYEYYHLVSGNDLPIKSMDFIHRFFDEHKGSEFIGVVKKTDIYRYRISRYYFFQNKIGRNREEADKFYLKLDRWVELLTNRMRHKRNESLELLYGSQWFSITDDLARYVLKNRKWIYRHFNYTFIPDELFLQSLLVDSAYLERVYKLENNSSFKSAMRYIDWKRGRPYVFQAEDYEELINSDMLFARKFNSELNPELTQKISRLLTGKERINF